MEIKTKTSTHNLATTTKEAKKITKNPIYKSMDKILGIDNFLEIMPTKGSSKHSNALIKATRGYALLLKVSSVDIELLSESDMRTFETVALSCTYGLDFDIKILRNNRKQDFKKYIEFVDAVSSKLEVNEYLENYKQSLYQELEKMEYSTGLNIKSGYILVYSDDFNDAVAKKAVIDRANYIISSLNNTQFNISLLSNFELLEYYYRLFHKGVDIDIQRFFELDCFELASTTEENPFEEIELTEEYVNSMIKQEEIEEAEQEIELRAKMTEKEFAKHKAKKLKEKSKVDKAHKEEMEQLKIRKANFLDILKPDVFREEIDYIQLGTSNYIRCLAVNVSPAYMNIGLFNTLNTIEDMEICVNLIKHNDGRMSKVLRKESNRIVSNYTLQENKTGNVEHRQRKYAQNIEGLIQAVETNSDKLFGMQTIVKVWASNLEELEKKTVLAQTMFANVGMDLKVLFYDQAPAFKTTMPTPCVEYNESYKIVTSSVASALIPNGCTHLRHREGIYIGKNCLNNNPIILDHFLSQKSNDPDSDSVSNPNVCILGRPGSGKSVGMKLIMARSILLGHIHVAFDPHQEYKKICDKLGGGYIYLKNGKKSGINPLEVKISLDEDGVRTVPLSEKIAETQNLINNFMSLHRNGKALGGIELTNVSEAIKAVYANFGITEDPESLFTINAEGEKVKKVLPILSDLKVELDKRKDRIGEVAEMFKLLTGDGVMSLFDCQTDPKIVDMLNTKLLCFSLKHLDNLTKTFTMTTLLNWLWSVFSDYSLRHIPKSIDIDEGWSLAKDKTTLEILDGFARSLRKYNTSLCFISQSLDELVESAEGRSILNFCSFKYIFKQDSKLSDSIGEYYGLSDSAVRAIPSFGKGQCIISTDAGNIMAQVDLFDFEKDFATTSGGGM